MICGSLGFLVAYGFRVPGVKKVCFHAGFDFLDPPGIPGRGSSCAHVGLHTDSLVKIF